jgi:hypothetical protein
MSTLNAERQLERMRKRLLQAKHYMAGLLLGHLIDLLSEWRSTQSIFEQVRSELLKPGFL